VSVSIIATCVCVWDCVALYLIVLDSISCFFFLHMARRTKVEKDFLWCTQWWHQLCHISLVVLLSWFLWPWLIGMQGLLWPEPLNDKSKLAQNHLESKLVQYQNMSQPEFCIFSYPYLSPYCIMQ